MSVFGLPNVLYPQNMCVDDTRCTYTRKMWVFDFIFVIFICIFQIETRFCLEKYICFWDPMSVYGLPNMLHPQYKCVDDTRCTYIRGKCEYYAKYEYLFSFLDFWFTFALYHILIILKILIEIVNVFDMWWVFMVYRTCCTPSKSAYGVYIHENHENIT